MNLNKQVQIKETGEIWHTITGLPAMADIKCCETNNFVFIGSPAVKGLHYASINDIESWESIDYFEDFFVICIAAIDGLPGAVVAGLKDSNGDYYLAAIYEGGTTWVSFSSAGLTDVVHAVDAWVDTADDSIYVAVVLWNSTSSASSIWVFNISSIFAFDSIEGYLRANDTTLRKLNLTSSLIYDINHIRYSDDTVQCAATTSNSSTTNMNMQRLMGIYGSTVNGDSWKRTYKVLNTATEYQKVFTRISKILNIKIGTITGTGTGNRFFLTCDSGVITMAPAKSILSSASNNATSLEKVEPALKYVVYKLSDDECVTIKADGIYLLSNLRIDTSTYALKADERFLSNPFGNVGPNEYNIPFMTSNGIIIAPFTANYSNDAYVTSNISYAKKEYLTDNGKYLDQNGLQEIHNQMMAYIQEVQQS